MTDDQPTRARYYFRASRVVAILVMATGVIVLAGWALDIGVLRSILPQWTTMKPNTALSFVLLGAALLALRCRTVSPWWRRLMLAGTALVMLMAFLTLLQYVFGWDLGIDRLLVRDPVGSPGVPYPGRMGPNTSLALLLFGMALFTLDARSPAGWRLSQYATVAAALLGLLGFVSYLYGAVLLYTVGQISQMAAHTSVTFMVLAAGILCARPDRGLMGIVVSDGPGGTVLRTLWPTFAILAIGIGWIVVQGVQAGLFDAPFGSGLTKVLLIVAFTPILLRIALLLYRTDAERREAAEELRQLNLELEERVRQRTAQLEASNKELEAFSYSVSHDLRSPLRSVDGFSRILLEKHADKLDERGRDYLRRMRDAAQRMARLIDDLLNLSRIGRAQMRHVPVDLSSMTDEIMHKYREQEPGRAVVIIIAPNMTVTGDPDLLRIVLDNLLGNAWKFTREKDLARIEVGVTARDDATVYFVRDNGAGFDVAYADKLFVPFQRLHTEEEFPGTGIGLAIVQRIIHRHGGQIWAEGEVGQGATFYFSLP